MYMVQKALLSLACLCAIVIVASEDQHPLESPNAARRGKNRPAITPELSDYAYSLTEKYEVQGLSIGVVYLDDKGVETEYRTWGVRTEDGDPTMPETLFQIGSCSKAFLAAAMGILMDDFAQGKNVTALPPTLKSFTWNTKIRELLAAEPEWKLSDPWASEKANIRDVLSHVSGLPRHDLSYKPYDTAEDVVKRMRLLKPTYELRERWQYNNQMYILGAHIITTYSGVHFTRFVKERIFTPLNMTSTTYFMDEAVRTGNMSQAFTANRRRIPLRLADRRTAELIAGAGAVISSTVDMSKWVATLLNDGVNPHTNQTIIPTQALKMVTSAYSVMIEQGPTPDSSIYGYGMGWWRYSYRGSEVVAHAGAVPGFATYTAFLPGEGFGAVILLNKLLGAGPVSELLFTRIVDDVLGLSHQQNAVAETASLPITSESIFGLRGIPGLVNSMSIDEPAPQPSLPLTAYEGTYANPAYGAFTLCSPVSTSNYCWQVIMTFGTVTPPGSIPGLYATWPGVVTSHLRLTPHGTHRFGLEVMTVHPEGYGKNKTAFVELDGFGESTSFLAEFIVDEESGRVQGMVLPAGFELPEHSLGSGDALEELQLQFNKVQ